MNEYSEFLLLHIFSFKNIKIQKFRFQNLGSLFFKHFSAKNIPFKNMKIQKSWFQNLIPLFFKHFSAKNIPFEIMKIHTNREFYKLKLTIMGDGKTHKRVICSLVNMTP